MAQSANPSVISNSNSSGTPITDIAVDAAGNLVASYANGGKLVISNTGGGAGIPYTLPPATGTALGGVKVGSGLAVAADGTITASAGSGTGTGSATTQPTRVVTMAGAVTATASDVLIVIRKTTGAATAVTLEATPATGRTLTIKDGLGDAGTNPITITPASGTIDGKASLTLAVGFGAVTIAYSGYEWGGV